MKAGGVAMTLNIASGGARRDAAAGTKLWEGIFTPRWLMQVGTYPKFVSLARTKCTQVGSREVSSRGS